MLISGTRQKAHIHVQARGATSCRHTVPLMGISSILLFPEAHTLELSYFQLLIKMDNRTNTFTCMH
jgi:hypothetical protein